jgi:hypothetical protein
MTVLWVLAAVVACGFVLDRLTTAPGARGVPVSTRLAEARRIAEGADHRVGTSAMRRASGPRSSAIRSCPKVTTRR